MTTDDHLDGIETSVATDADQDISLDELEALACDPDPARDLGYEVADWERLQTGGENGGTVFLPETEDDLLDEAFIVVEESALCELRTRA